MIVVVETNFIIELVRQQEEVEACEDLVSLCSDSEARMAVPAFAIAEAGMVLEARRGERRSFVQQVARHAREIGRSRTLGRFESVLRDLKNELLSAETDEASRWLSFRADLDRLHVIPMDAEVLEETSAIQYGREINLLPDAIIFASVKKYLEKTRTAGVADAACFVSRDNKAFRTPAILKQLRKLDCTFVNSFGNAAARVRAAISRP